MVTVTPEDKGDGLVGSVITVKEVCNRVLCSVQDRCSSLVAGEQESKNLLKVLKLVAQNKNSLHEFTCP